MPVGLTVFWLRGNARSQKIAEALRLGAERAGYRVRLREDGAYKGVSEPVVAFYGYQKTMPRIMADYLAVGKHVVFCDLGYWHRQRGGRFQGYHKIAVNGRHPSPAQLAAPCGDARLRAFKVEAKPWRKQGDYILLAGMSAKSAESYGYGAQQWEAMAVRELRRHTDRRIIYRPKPSWLGARPIPGAEMQQPSVPLHVALADCHAVVTHHSNVAVDALVAGVPTFCWDGAAVPLSLQDFSRIEEPVMPEGRETWLAALAYCQWNVREMMSGAMWRHLKSAGLVP